MSGADHARLIEDPALLRETLVAMRETGVSVFDVEIVRLIPDFAVERVKPFLEVCGAVGAKAILVSGDDPDEARMTANYAEFCEAARPYGLTADLEFMPWTRVHNARTARRVVTNAAQPNGGILVDALHFARSQSSLEDIRALPRSLLHYIQICDAPGQAPSTVEELLHTARAERVLPGTGGIDLVSLLSGLPRDIPVSVELPNDAKKASLGIEEWSRRALAASRAVIAELPAA
jgi:sugar phosphate isomerase/epimerase